MRSISVDTDFLETLARRHYELEQRVKGLEKTAHPTVPVYDGTIAAAPTNFPLDPVVGQVAIADDETMWFYGTDLIWHQVGGGVPGPWHYVGATGEPAFVNSWHNDTGGSPLRFRFAGNGDTDVEGSVGGGTPGTTVTTLPLAYRPPYEVDDVNSAGASREYVAKWLLQTDGQLKMMRVDV